MPKHPVFAMAFAKVYPLYVQKAERKGRTKKEVDQVIRGGNYGWNIKEGRHCFNPGNPDVSPETCPSTDQFGDVLIDPVIEYANVRNPLTGLGTAVIGGFMYRGFELEGYFGRYIFGDFSTSLVVPRGRVWVATPRSSTYSSSRRRHAALWGSGRSPARWCARRTALASSSTSCLRASKRELDMPNVNASMKASSEQYAAST